jgi:hypothetical protein
MRIAGEKDKNAIAKLTRMLAIAYYLARFDIIPFSDFTNPYKNPADVPKKYSQHINLQKLFKADGFYVQI